MDKLDLSGIKLLAKLGLIALGVGVIASKIPNETPKPPEGPPAPKEIDFSSNDPKVLASNAQMAREMHALEQENSARVLDQMNAPPPGTAARALEHISDEFLAAGKLEIAAKLRSVAKQIYPEPAPSPVPSTPS
jgi:hypothetical protein